MGSWRRPFAVGSWIAILAGVACRLPLPAAANPDAVTIVVRFLGMATRGLAAYLVIATGLALAAEISAARPLCRVAAWVAPRAVRVFVAATLSVPTTSSIHAAFAQTSIVQIVAAEPASPVPRPPSTPAAHDPAAGRTGRSPAHATWTVRPGDHFWSIAQAITPAGQEVPTVWRALVEANRTNLVAPGNSDLIVPGQVLRLPEVARTSASDRTEPGS